MDLVLGASCCALPSAWRALQHRRPMRSLTAASQPLRITDEEDHVEVVTQHRSQWFHDINMQEHWSNKMQIWNLIWMYSRSCNGKKHSKPGFSHLVLPSFWASEGREDLLVEYAMWTHLDRSPSSHRSACFDPAAATVQQKLSFSLMWEISDAARELPTLNWVGKDTNSLISSFEDESAGFRISLGSFWGVANG